VAGGDEGTSSPAAESLRVSTGPREDSLLGVSVSVDTIGPVSLANNSCNSKSLQEKSWTNRVPCDEAVSGTSQGWCRNGSRAL